MLLNGAGLGDMGWSPPNPFKAAKKAAKGIAKGAKGAVKFTTRTLPMAAGKAVLAPHLLALKTTTALARGVASTAGKVAGGVVRAPLDVLSAAGSGFGSKFKSAQAERSPRDQATVDAAAEAQQRYTAGGSGGGGSGGEYGTTSSALTAEGDPAAAGGMSTPVKLAIAAGALVGVYFLYRKFGGRSARLSKS